jgi:hypothetical protein
MATDAFDGNHNVQEAGNEMDDGMDLSNDKSMVALSKETIITLSQMRMHYLICPSKDWV